mmetsp:Transcript_17506/g.38189  ORF Transcript_17506/g.38189 Transcript_17506/m.38189 type:complete len:173 (-) Transcript_17506:1654-2172(-)
MLFLPRHVNTKDTPYMGSLLVPDKPPRLATRVASMTTRADSSVEAFVDESERSTSSSNEDTDSCSSFIEPIFPSRVVDRPPRIATRVKSIETEYFKSRQHETKIYHSSQRDDENGMITPTPTHIHLPSVSTDGDVAPKVACRVKSDRILNIKQQSGEETRSSSQITKNAKAA